MRAFIIPLYLVAAVLCVILIRPGKGILEDDMPGAVCLSLLWPYFLLLVITWGTGFVLESIPDWIIRLFQKIIHR